MGPEPAPRGPGDDATRPTVPPPVIRIEHLTKRLRNGITAVDDLSLTVDGGQVLGLVGPNGSGKTLTLKVLLGLVRPTSGSAWLFGEPVGPGAGVLARVGALVDGPGFVPHLSGRKNLELACRQLRRTGDHPDLDGAVSLTGLGEAIDRPYSGYSHGMRYRLAMSQALLGRPDLLLLDEPTTGMDPAQVIEVREAIATSAAAGATVVLSSHHLSEVEEVCTHAAVLRTGRLLAAGAMADLVQRHHRVHVSVDDAERAAAVLDSGAGVAGVAAVDRSTVVVDGISLRGIDLVVTLDEAGIAVAGFRGSTFEDTYLSLFDDGSLTPTGPPPELP